MSWGVVPRGWPSTPIVVAMSTLGVKAEFLNIPVKPEPGVPMCLFKRLVPVSAADGGFSASDVELDVPAKRACITSSESSRKLPIGAMPAPPAAIPQALTNSLVRAHTASHTDHPGPDMAASATTSVSGSSVASTDVFTSAASSAAARATNVLTSAASSAAARAVAEAHMKGFKSAQDRHNHFTKGIRIAPQEVKDKWTETMKLGRMNEARQCFVAAVARDDGSFDTPYFRKLREVAHEKKNGTKGKMVSYEKLVDIRGRILADELIRLKLVDMNEYGELVGQQHNVPFPHNYEFSTAQRAWSDMHSVKDATVLQGSADATAEAIDEFHKQTEQTNPPVTVVHVGVPSQSPGNDGKPGNLIVPPVSEEELEKAKKCLSKAHGDFDRRNRDWQGVLERSAANKYTNGCMFETELTATVTRCKALDSLLMDLDKKYKVAKEWTSEEAEEIKAHCAEMLALLKEGGGKSALIESWLKESQSATATKTEKQ